jgi:glycosyltransferase involved in cell wall biosynthesis
MRGGGSERVISILLNHLDREKFDITLILLKKEGIYLADLPSDIKIIDLDIKQARYALFAIIKQIKEIQPNIVFSTLGYLNILISIIRPFFSKKIKFIARESNTVSIQNKQEKYPRLFDFLYRRFYSNFDNIIAQSKYMKNDLIKNFSINSDLIKIIYNPVDIEFINSKKESNKILFDKNKINLLSVGRLSHQKGYDVLLKTISRLDEIFHLHIVGDGKEKEKLLNLSKELKIKDRIHFLGFQKNPYRYMSQASLLILSSRYEGLPNVVLEANACGLPVIAYDCPGGTGEIVKNGINGFLIECGDIDKLALKIEDAIKREWNRNNIIKLIMERYSLTNIILEYEEVLK